MPAARPSLGQHDPGQRIRCGCAAVAIIASVLSGCATGISNTPIPTAPTPLATGGVSKSAMIFSPYKFAPVGMHASAHLLGTAVSGTDLSLARALQGTKAAASLAFATGECGEEKWGGIDGVIMANANLGQLQAAGVDYLLSTGGEGAQFTCGTDAGFTRFINRWASPNLLGVDFDIEAGQTVDMINALVQRAVAAEQAFPKLRFSFTLATLAAAPAGSEIAVSRGSAAPDNYNQYGDRVMRAIAAYGLKSYTINLMAMDYGSPGSNVCVISGGHCDMGQSAIQSAMNLHDHWGVPYSQIELTVMIGLNDVTNEQFTLPDVDTVVVWAKATGLAGLHYWSYDRDCDCAQAVASDSCNSMGTAYAGPLGYFQRFSKHLD
jgi:chitinase